MTRCQVDFTDSVLKCKLNRSREQGSSHALSSPPSIDAGTELGTVAIDGEVHESRYLAIGSRYCHGDVTCEVDTCNVSINTVIR